MIIKIHRLLKDDLSKQETLNVVSAGLSETNGMTISHFAYAPKQTEATIPYSIEIMQENVPIITNIDFCVVVRTKVDLTATGPDVKTKTDIGNDVGEYNYKNNVPARPLDLPLGFQELYRG